MSAAKYAVGIDLGTTHCALSYVELDADTESEQALQEVLPIPQLTAPGSVDALPLLPSFIYLPHATELAPGDLTLPWAEQTAYALGEFARSRGALTPIRTVSSAKSWLSHSGVDRRADILPQDAPEEVARLSPLQASVRYLEHLRDAWNHRFPDAPLNRQDVTITIPASFDPAARELTAEAAEQAGCHQANLLEEPQAALYSWIQGSMGEWRKQVSPGDIVLVVDVGGGTTDLSLIAVIDREGKMEPHRIAVGDHILLGGDNMDLALAHVISAKLMQQGTQLDPWQLRAVTHGCRVAKETLLIDTGQDTVPLVVPSRGSRLIGGSIRTELTRDEVRRTLIEGFFPQVEASARPIARPRTGLMQLGLPYAQDAAITRHLAAFLGRQTMAASELPGFRESREGASFIHPTAVLFNGGIFKSPLLSERILDNLNHWLAKEQAPPARLLSGADLDLAVARGAAYYGRVKRGGGVRIRGGTAQSFYVGIETSMPAVPGLEPPVMALCVAPFGMEEGSAANPLPQEFGLVVGEPVRFRFFESSVRRTDEVGMMLESWSGEELRELGEIEVSLSAERRNLGEVVPVRLQAAVTETGTLRLEASPVEGDERWKVELDVR